jgi:hypothetical protein
MAPGPLRVFETVPAAGLRLRAFEDGRLALDLGALVGIETHSYRYVTSTVNSRGLAGDFSIEGALGFAVQLWNEHELQLMFRGGRSGRERKHTLEGQVIWQREPWRVGGTIGLTFGRRVRR